MVVSPIALSATATEHGGQLVSAVDWTLRLLCKMCVCDFANCASVALQIVQHTHTHTTTVLAFRCSYLASIVIPLEIAKAGRQVPKPRCLSPAAHSLDIRIAGRQMPKPRCLNPAAHSLDVRIAGRQSPAAHSLDVRIAGRQVPDLHGVSKQLYLARIAWTPFTGTDGSREPPVPRGVLVARCLSLGA